MFFFGWECEFFHQVLSDSQWDFRVLIFWERLRAWPKDLLVLQSCYIFKILLSSLKRGLRFVWRYWGTIEKNKQISKLWRFSCMIDLLFHKARLPKHWSCVMFNHHHHCHRYVSWDHLTHYQNINIIHFSLKYCYLFII